MGKIRDYELLEEFKGDETFVVETDRGTKSLSVGAIKAHITTAIEEKSDMLNQNDIEIEADTESDYRLTITIGAKTVTTPNLRGKSIKEIKLASGHLMIYFTDETEIDLGVLDGSIAKYGVCRDIPSHSPVLERVGDAKGLVAETALGNNAVRNDFDSIYPWCDIKRCTLADDGTVTSYEGDPDFATDGSKGQVMVEIPVYWKAHYLNESGTKEYTYISREKADSRYFIPKRFIDKNGNVLNKIYIAAYAVTIDADGKAESRTGTEGPVIRDLETMKAYCEARGDGWHPYGIWDYEVIKDLFTVEFATLDTQSIMLGVQESSYTESVLCYSSAEMWSRDDTTGLTETVTSFVEECDEPSLCIGQEVCINAADTASATGAFDSIDENTAIVRRVITGIEKINLQWTGDEGETYDTPGCLYNFEGLPVKVYGEFTVKSSFSRNGLTDFINTPTGELCGQDFKRPFKYRHMENIYCGQQSFLFGVLVKGGEYYVCENPEEYGKTVMDTYKKLSYSRPEASGYIMEMGCDTMYPYVCLPEKIGGTSDTDFCDEFRKEGGRVDPERSNTMHLKGGGALSSGLYALETIHTTDLSATRLSYSYNE